MNEISQVHGGPRRVTRAALDRHVQGALAKEGLTGRGHVRHVVRHHVHLDHRLAGVEQRLGTAQQPTNEARIGLTRDSATTDQ